MKTNYDLYENEKRLNQEGYKYIVGIDEAGRGSLFGPVAVGACILPIDLKLDRLTDSKRLNKKYL